jgi:hypothetical protein
MIYMKDYVESLIERRFGQSRITTPLWPLFQKTEYRKRACEIAASPALVYVVK